jgi:hypothetical protein
MKLIQLFLIGTIIFLSACQKDNINVTLITAGNLKVQIKDSTGETYPNVKVHIYSSYSYTSSGYSVGSELDAQKTDSKGNIDFGTISAANYLIVSDTIKIGGTCFITAKPVQIISGDSKFIPLNPNEYIGTLKTTFYVNSGSGTDTLTRTRIKVALVKTSDYSSKLNRTKVLKKAVSVKTFGADGKAAFTNVPANISYRTYVFINDNDTVGSWGSSSYWIGKDQIVNGTADGNLNEMLIIRATVSVTMTYYSSSSGTNKSFASANVVLVTSSDYSYYSLYSASVSTVLSHMVTSAKTDASGKCTVIVPASSSYYVFVYTDNTHSSWTTSYLSLSSSTSQTASLNVNGSYFGLTK